MQTFGVATSNGSNEDDDWEASGSEGSTPKGRLFRSASSKNLRPQPPLYHVVEVRESSEDLAPRMTVYGPSSVPPMPTQHGLRLPTPAGWEGRRYGRWS